MLYVKCFFIDGMKKVITSVAAHSLEPSNGRKTQQQSINQVKKPTNIWLGNSAHVFKCNGGFMNLKRNENYFCSLARNDNKIYRKLVSGARTGKPDTAGAYSRQD